MTSQSSQPEGSQSIGRNQKTFQYQPLGGDRSIRLLTILPGNDDQPLRCSCSIVSLNDSSQTPFEAISYVWGDDTKNCAIDINKCELKITKSAYTVLAAARLATSSRIVWIDAICIDQLNIDEKNQQVPLMKDIYSTATSVFAWLGEASPDSGSAIMLLAMLKKIYIAYHNGITYEITPHAGGSDKISLQDLCKMTGQIDSNQWAALRALLKRPWFRRIWVYQEAVLAKSITLVFGRYSVDFRDFSPIMHWLMYCQASTIFHYRDDPEDRRLFRPTLNGLANLDRMHETRFKRRYDKYSLDLEEHLCELVHWEAKDPRDFIYGVLGITEEAAFKDLKPNYNSSAVEVFAAATKWIITSKKSLEIILTTRWPRQDLPERVEGLPSWVPDFTARHIAPPIGTMGEKSLDARISREAFVRFDGAKLIAKGYRVGQIDSLGRPNDRFFEDQKAQHIAIADWISESVASLQPVVTTQLWHTMIQGQTTEGELRATGHTHHAGYEHWQTMVKYMRARNLSFQRMQSFFKLALRPTSMVRGLNYASVLSTLTHRRRLAKISIRVKPDLNPLGVAPQEALVGDIVCVLFGTSVPVLLRRDQNQDSFHVVGGCYVEGISSIIDGMTSGPSPWIQEEEFCIS